MDNKRTLLEWVRRTISENEFNMKNIDSKKSRVFLEFRPKSNRKILTWHLFMLCTFSWHWFSLKKIHTQNNCLFLSKWAKIKKEMHWNLPANTNKRLRKCIESHWICCEYEKSRDTKKARTQFNATRL